MGKQEDIIASRMMNRLKPSVKKTPRRKIPKVKEEDIASRMMNRFNTKTPQRNIPKGKGKEEDIASRMMNRVLIQEVPIVKEVPIKRVQFNNPIKRVQFKDPIKESRTDEEQIASRMMNRLHEPEYESDYESEPESDPERPGYFTIMRNLQTVKGEEKEAKKKKIVAYKEQEKRNSEILDEFKRILELRDKPVQFRSRMNKLLEKLEILEEEERISGEIRRLSDLERSERKKRFLDQYTLHTGEVVETYPDEEDGYPKKTYIFRDNVVKELSEIERTLI